MFCQQYASSLPLGDRSPESRRFTDLTIDTVAIFAQTRTRTIDWFERVSNVSRLDRFRDPTDHR